jgi:hypothetical protein
MIKWIKNFFTINKDKPFSFYNGSLEDWKKEQEYLNRDHIGEMSNMLSNDINEEISKDILTKLLKLKNKDE